MSERAAKRVYAGFSSLEGGMDSGRAPHLLAPNQVSNAFNTTFRGGHPRPRPAWYKIDLRFMSETIRGRFQEEGRWQHGAYYRPDFGPSSLIAVVGGRFFQLRVGADNSVQEITINTTDPTTGDVTYYPNSSKKDRGWSHQGELFWVYNDGESKPFIFDGSSGRRAGAGELQAGTVIRYVKGRFWYSLPSGMAFRAGDIVRGQGRGNAYQGRDSILKETENIFLNEGGDFAVPGGSGGIQAMMPVAVLDTSTGQGPLQVLTTNTIFSVNAPTDRNLWKDVTYPIQTESNIGAGGQSQLSTVNVNSDLFFRAKDGIRSLKLNREQQNTRWINVPQSSEMNRQLTRDNRKLLQYSSAIEFDNRLLQTYSPVYSERGIYHRGLAVLDFDLISSLRKPSDPAYDGSWTGLRILQLVKGEFDGVERAFMFVLNSQDQIELWEQTIEGHFDNGTKRIVWGFESSRYSFTSGVTQLKRLDGGHFFVDAVEGFLDYDIRYRPDSYPFWIFWLSGQKCAAQNTCEVEEGGCLTMEQFQQQYFPHVGLTEPDDVCNPVVGRMFRDLYQCQVRFQFEGYASITEGQFYATDQIQSPSGECAVNEAVCEPLTGCDLSPYSYSAEE